jgi:hypothetical protein
LAVSAGFAGVVMFGGGSFVRASEAHAVEGIFSLISL